MVKSVESRERVSQKSAGLKQRHIEFIYWAESNIPDFDWNKLIRDALENQMNILKEIYPEVEKFL